MDLKKIIKNKRSLLIGGVAIATLVTLTGCGKADVNIKVYDKENEVQQIINDAVSQVENEIENQSSDNTTTNETSDKIIVAQKDEANEAIRKALKDEDWLKENILPNYFNYTGEDFKKWQDNTKVYLGKGKDIEGIPVYYVYVTSEMFRDLHLVTYKDGNVITSALGVKEKYGLVRVDLNTNTVITETMGPDDEGYTEDSRTYMIENNEFVEFAQLRVNENDGDIYCYVNGENVSYGRYKMYSENAVKLETELTNENIDTYVK